MDIHTGKNIHMLYSIKKMMRIKFIILNLFFLAVTLKGVSQSLMPLNWKLDLKKDSIIKESHPVNLLLSWERQGLSYLSPSGALSTSFYIPEMTMPSNFTLEFNLLLDVHEIYINGFHIGGDVPAKFIWSPTPKYETNKLIVPKKYLNFGKKNTIIINCSNFSYTGGKSHNKVLLYSGNKSFESKIDVLFTPKDHLFLNSDDVTFNLNTDTNSDGTLNLLIRNDYLDTLFIKEINLKKGIRSHHIDLKKEKLPPGFYEVIASLKTEGYAGTVDWFTVAPTKIKKSSVAPVGFNEFWNNAMDELNTIAPQFKMTKVDSLCTSKRNGYVVEMQSIGDVTIRGYYFVPKQKTSYAAILNLPGYGYGFEYLDEFLKNDENVIELAICVRGHGISKDAFNTEFPVPGFIGYNICDKENTVYRQIYMDCIRALEFLLSREEVDKSKIGVLGGSQGGGLTIMTAGLASEHIAACAYFDPFPTDLKNHIKIRTLIKDEVKSYLEYYNDACSFDQAITTLDFLDTKYFAKKIKCPTFYVTGLLDDDCPSRLGFSVFNEISAQKQFKIFPKDSHIGESNNKKDMMLFFKNQFGF